jgi:hypothetical protein
MEVPRLLTHPKPNIADVRCHRIQFQPGDRVLVRCYRKLGPDEQRRLRRSIVKWAGCEVEVLIINAMEVDIAVEKRL